MNILVIGTGYVGTTTALIFAELGHKVTGLEIDAKKIEKLLLGKLHFYEDGLEDLLNKHQSLGNIQFTMNSESAIKNNDIIFICVGTPSNKDGSANLNYVEKVARTIGTYLNKYKVIVNKSTVPVGTADMVRKWIMESASSDHPFDVVSNPEFLREGNALNDALHPDRIIIGSENEAAAQIIKDIYLGLNSPVIITKPKAAELIKYAANSFLALKISYVNELSKLCDQIGINIQDISRGMGSDHRIGEHFLQAGIGYGGSCFPKDVMALMDSAKQHGIQLSILKNAVEVNKAQPFYFFKKINEKLQGIENKLVAVLGLSFKPNTDDTRESPSLIMIEMLLQAKAKVKVHDPISKLPQGAHHILQCNSIEEALENADAVVICTDWPQYKEIDWNVMIRKMKQPYVFDGRNMLSAQKMKEIGFVYEGIGYK